MPRRDAEGRAIDGPVFDVKVQTDMTPNRNNPVPSVILSHPQLGENIGAAARAMKNFGLSDLRLVAPRDGWPNKKADAMAAGALDIVRHARVHDDLRRALFELQLVFATTARDRGTTKEVITPAEAAKRLRM